MNGCLGWPAPLVVKMLTTAGIARLAASRYEPWAGGRFDGASISGTDDPLRTMRAPPVMPAAHSGFRLVTMNHIARPTVTVWANNSHRRRIRGVRVNLKSVSRSELAKYLDQALDITRFRDYCPNGLQVEGRERIASIVTGVTASLALIDAAIELD